MLAAKMSKWEVRMEPDFVDAEDLKDCWNHTQENKAGWGLPKPGTAFGLTLPGRFRGLDSQALMHRLMWLLMLEQVSKIGLVEFPYFHEGKPNDAVFKALAKIKIADEQRRRETGGMMPFPFELDELKRLIENEPKAR
jgi:hypothetical protein